MRQDLTDITFVIDRSGSMQAMQTDAEGGVNAFMQRQAAEPGEALITLVQFDTEYEFVHQGLSAKTVPHYTLVPRGSTALLDAVGRAINETGARLAKLPEPDRPALVIFVVVTDGQENASREFSKEQIKQMIEHQQKNYQWQFTFLGANQDAFAEAGGMGMHAGGAAAFTVATAGVTFDLVAAKVARMRHESAAAAPVDNSWTDEEREAMK
jgi:Mg-chelatase subunit ChlD